MNPDDPQALESTLAAYRRLPRAEPAAALDAAVRAHARAAIAARPRQRWPVLFATAATVLLAASLGWRTWRAGSEQPAPLVPASVPAESAARSAPSTSGRELADGREAEADAASAVPLRQTLHESAAPAPTDGPQQAPAAAAERRTAEPARDAEQSVEEIPQAFAEPPATVPAPAAAPAVAPTAAPPAPPAGPAPSAASGLAKSIEAAPMESQADAAGQPAADNAADALSAKPEAGRARREDAAPAAANLGGLRANPATTSGAGSDRLRRQAGTHATPDEGLQAIRELQRQGRLVEAREALAAWRLDWPDAVVPEDLRNLQQ